MLIILFWCVSAQAGRTSGYLNEECSKLEKAPKDQKALIADVYCASYIDGVIDGYRIMSDLHPQTRFICLPTAGMTTHKAIQIFQKWLKNNPKNSATPSRSGVLLSLKEAFPCPKK